ncbi:MAG: hypothetical protein RLP16_01580 [Alphaproteobacteria bacterium]
MALVLAQSHMEILPPERAGIRANVVETVRPKGPVQGRDGQRPGAVRRLPLPAEAEKPTPFEGSGTAARDKAAFEPSRDALVVYRDLAREVSVTDHRFTGFVVQQLAQESMSPGLSIDPYAAASRAYHLTDRGGASHAFRITA